MIKTTPAFKKTYNSLNALQRQAVDTIFGPVLVVAGPGTGKTQLLASRVGQILAKTDATPQNILSLTFTESARTEMQQRLVKLIGPEGYKVPVHTFHSFGSHIMGAYNDRFTEAFGFRPADDLTRYEIINRLLERLPYENPLSRIYQGEYLYLKDIQQRISQLRQAGITPKDLRTVVKNDQAWLKQSQPLLKRYLKTVDRITQKNQKAFVQLASRLKTPSTKSKNIKPLGLIAAVQLQAAIAESQKQSSTKPLTEWKNRWLTRNRASEWVFRAARQLEKLSALSEIYEAYSKALAAQKLFDYDDMILNVSSKLEEDSELRAELQEQYQYILVDEYQDSSGAQIKLLNLLADNKTAEGRPNLMVVGDDDQAIYSFQGAYASNLVDFLTQWESVKTVVLNQNYRSTPDILQFIRAVIKEGEDRLENRYPELNKELVSRKAEGLKPQLNQFDSAVEQYLLLARQLKNDLKEAVRASQIAILAPKHKYLETLVPFLFDQGLPVAYEKRENVLDDQHIVELTHLARVITALAAGEIRRVNQLLPELLSYKWWGVSPETLWQLSLSAEDHKAHHWLEAMRVSKNKSLRDIASWLLKMAKAAPSTPLELMLDLLIGPEKSTKTFSSPYRRHYFPLKSLEKSQVEYLRLLSGLISLRSQLRQYAPNKDLRIKDFVQFVDLRRGADLKIINDHPVVLNQEALQLLTAHKAKGQEFEKVYIINADQHTWVSEKGRINRMSLPPNLNIAPAGETFDERLRLFYVAASRAKNDLIMTSFVKDEQGITNLPLGWLEQSEVTEGLKIIEPEQQPKPKTSTLVRGLSFDWRTPHFELTQQVPWRDLLSSVIKNYSLNPTHLNTFLDVTKGGPKRFLVDQLLRFPKAQSVNASFGDAMHTLMQRLHSHHIQQHKLPPKSTAKRWFEEEISRLKLTELDQSKQLRRGHIDIDFLYQKGKSKFKLNQIVERNFAGEGVVIEGARLRGDVDRIDINNKDKTMFVVDYKTGKSAESWPTQAAKVTATNSHDLLKLYKYKNQLLFYKLLIEGSHSFGGRYKVLSAALEYLEPDEAGNLNKLELQFNLSDLNRLKKLITAIWQKIINVDLPDTSIYAPDFSGVRQFEEDLINGKI